jgi:hypothetical protein
VALGEVVRQLVRRGAERDHEGQVEEQFERRGGPVVLVRVTSAHSGPAVHREHGHGGV